MSPQPKIKVVCGVLTEQCEMSYTDEWQQTNLLLVTLIGTWAYEDVLDKNNLFALRRSKYTIYVRPLNDFPAFYATKEQIASSFELRLFQRKLQDQVARSISRRVTRYLPAPTYDFDTKLINYSGARQSESKDPYHA